MDKAIEALLRAGRTADALAAADAAGRPDWRRAIHKRRLAWDDAADAALAAGDRQGALEDLIEGGRTGRATTLVQEILADGPAAAAAAARALGTRAPALVARLREHAGDLAGAAEAYRRAGALADQARVLEAAGKLHEAGAAYEAALKREPHGDVAQRARLGLAGLLERLGRAADAIPLLQDAARQAAGPDRAAALTRLHALLLASGLTSAAREIERELTSLGAPPARMPSAVDPELLCGRWRILAELGAGATGRVVRARDELTGQDVALKLIAPTASSPAALARFVREATLLGGLEHPNVVRFLDARPEAGVFAMELAAGTLEREIAPRVPPARLVPIALDVCAALEAAHVRGIVHRDVKPANVLLDAGGTAKLGDFGAAHLVDLGATQTGGLVGTLAYMAPEQITAGEITFRTDLYGLGATLFHALTGRLPFPGPDFVAQHLGDAPPPLPDELAAWTPLLHALLAKDPAQRPDALSSVRASLRALRPAPPIALLLSASAPEPVPVPEPEPVLSLPLPPTSAPRFHSETPLTPTTTRAVDSTLHRTVVLEHHTSPPPRLAGLARAGGPELQRILAFHPALQLLVFEAPVGVPLTTPPPAAHAPAIALDLTRGLVRLHDANVVHGAITPARVLYSPSTGTTLLAAGLGDEGLDATPLDDVHAVCAILATLGDDHLAAIAATSPPTARALLEALRASE